MNERFPQALGFRKWCMQYFVGLKISNAYGNRVDREIKRHLRRPLRSVLIVSISRLVTARAIYLKLCTLHMIPYFDLKLCTLHMNP
jgi:hypothetical protein